MAIRGTSSLNINGISTISELAKNNVEWLMNEIYLLKSIQVPTL